MQKNWRCKVHRQRQGGTKRFPNRYRKLEEIIEWRGKELVNAAQVILSIEVEIVKKSRLGTKTH